MITATEALKNQQDSRDEHVLNLRMEDFLKKYKPRESYAATHFEVDLHSLVRAIFAEATKPYEKILAASWSARPMETLFIKPKE